MLFVECMSKSNWLKLHFHYLSFIYFKISSDLLFISNLLVIYWRLRKNQTSTMANYYILSDISISDIQPQIWNSRPRVLISGRGFESGFEDWSTYPRPMFLGSDIRPRISSNLVLKLMSLQWSHLLNYIHEVPQLISLCINFEGRLYYSV